MKSQSISTTGIGKCYKLGLPPQLAAHSCIFLPSFLYPRTSRHQATRVLGLSIPETPVLPRGRQGSSGDSPIASPSSAHPLSSVRSPRGCGGSRLRPFVHTIDTCRAILPASHWSGDPAMGQSCCPLPAWGGGSCWAPCTTHVALLQLTAPGPILQLRKLWSLECQVSSSHLSSSKDPALTLPNDAGSDVLFLV